MGDLILNAIAVTVEVAVILVFAAAAFAPALQEWMDKQEGKKL